MSGAIRTQGTLVQRGNGATPEVFTTIGEVVDFSGPGGKASIIDTTHLGSVAKEKLPGLPDEGSFTLTLNWVPSDAQQTALETDRYNQTLRNFRVVYTDLGATQRNFAAFVMGFQTDGKADDKVVAKVDLEISGRVTRT